MMGRVETFNSGRFTTARGEERVGVHRQISRLERKLNMAKREWDIKSVGKINQRIRQLKMQLL